MKLFQFNFSRCVRILLAPLFIAALAACGGGGSSSPNFFNAPGGNGGTGGTGGTGGGGTGGGGGTTTTASFGAVINGTFVQGEAFIAVTNLSAGGMTEVTVNLVDQNGNPITDTLTFFFNSGCVADGTASLTANVESSTGQATAEYTAEGCVGSDEIRVTVTYNDETFTAIGTVVVEQENIGSLEFVSASPEQIALAGTGGDETSRVTFRVVGQAGAPIRDANVDFALNSTTGGLDLAPTSAISNSDGEVSTIVQAGTIATAVRVTATEQSTGVSTQSSQLVVSTGIPDFDSFSLSQDIFNVEGLNFDGKEVQLTIRAADAFNNPVPQGTTVSFYAEGGSVDPSCSTGADGACTVTWRSQNPRPTDGRVTILASAIGNESFTDQDGDGRFDDAEFSAANDLGEAFADENEDGDHDLGEFFVDFGTPNGVRDGADMMYNGVLCSSTATLCSPEQSVTVFEQAIIVMSGSGVDVVSMIDDDLNAVPPGSTIDTTDDAANNRSYTFSVQDINGNPMPVGTQVSMSVTDGFELTGISSFEVAPQSGFGPSQSPGSFTVRKEPTGTETLGTMTLTVTTDENVVSLFNWTLTAP